jgi:murein DD-endopeptidase MepM/ murein hydrolase activator NlpD
MERHKRVFAGTARLSFARFASLSISFAGKQTVKSLFSPYLNYLSKREVISEKSAANKLFRRYAYAVAGLFVVGTIIPSGAFYQDARAFQIDAGMDNGGYDYAMITDNDGYITKINPQTTAGDRSTMNDRLAHTVAPGETVSTIAASYGLKTSTILWENGLSNPNSIKIGQQLLIPPVDGVTHKVAKGEDLSKIANEYGVSSESIIKQNRLTADAVTVGQEIFIPGGKPLVTQDDKVAAPTVRTTPARVGTSTRANAKPSGAIMRDTDSTPAAGRPFIFPTRGGITQGYHAGHYAYDIADRSQPPVWAAGQGKVVKVVSGCAKVSYGCGGGYGNHVIIDHGNGLQTLYGHLEEVYVNQGDTVSQGTVIGKMGRSGNVRGATGIHLHFEVHLNGKKMVPGNYY